MHEYFTKYVKENIIFEYFTDSSLLKKLIV